MNASQGIEFQVRDGIGHPEFPQPVRPFADPNQYVPKCRLAKALTVPAVLSGKPRIPVFVRRDVRESQAIGNDAIATKRLDYCPRNQFRPDVQARNGS